MARWGYQRLPQLQLYNAHTILCNITSPRRCPLNWFLHWYHDGPTLGGRGNFKFHTVIWSYGHPASVFYQETNHRVDTYLFGHTGSSKLQSLIRTHWRGNLPDGSGHLCISDCLQQSTKPFHIEARRSRDEHILTIVTQVNGLAMDSLAWSFFLVFSEAYWVRCGFITFRNLNNC